MATPAPGPAAPAHPGTDEEVVQPTPVPDEDGPHDVPDETVIEHTLPSRPATGPGKMPMAD
ncbi:hypothetical protein JI739_16655 [Ramlibacter sp. AW1]|uniref:Uncharacterized protein n=1 Tax=Ramlibacter aurantiacus TaxID=2801330 RepID=A0A936ZR70_9BURK|nr:hypothetical protein [Ramlibacter aurantiacus]MBL0421983.1 hypothetical protein [Ramlibacter aurantiacus]